jgi:hypothetical protein
MSLYSILSYQTRKFYFFCVVFICHLWSVCLSVSITFSHVISQLARFS